MGCSRVRQIWVQVLDQIAATSYRILRKSLKFSPVSLGRYEDQVNFLDKMTHNIILCVPIRYPEIIAINITNLQNLH